MAQTCSKDKRWEDLVLLLQVLYHESKSMRSCHFTRNIWSVEAHLHCTCFIQPSASQGAFPLSDENTLALPVPADSDGESDSSDRIPVPSFQNSFSQAIEAALLKLDKPSTAAHLSGKRWGGEWKNRVFPLLPVGEVRAAILGTKNWPQNSAENCQVVVSEQLDSGFC